MTHPPGDYSNLIQQTGHSARVLPRLGDDRQTMNPITLSVREKGRSNMKTTLIKTTLLFGTVLLAAMSQSGRAQPYSLDWLTIDGGGGTSTGGVYAVTGTIGQPDAGPLMVGGDFTVRGGFWSFIAAIQTPGAPLLRIAASGAGEATVWWEPDTPGWVLQETLSLSSAAWTNAPSGATNPVVVPATLPTKFYRLHKP